MPKKTYTKKRKPKGKSSCNIICKNKSSKSKTKRKLTPWNLFVQKVWKREKSSGITFKECLKLASKLKKEGKMD